MGLRSRDSLVWGLGLTLLCVAVGVLGHGRLMYPPSRSSAWRLGFDTPQNYNDNELFCGGFGVCFARGGTSIRGGTKFSDGARVHGGTRTHDNTVYMFIFYGKILYAFAS